MASSLPLSKALSQLRDELRDARLHADPEMQLKISTIQLDLSLEVASVIKGGVEATVWSVLTGNAAVERGKTQVHRLSLTIEPTMIDADGNKGDLHVSTGPISDND
jgi:hypothetical protein